jgi:hypothetical protein
MDNWVWGGRFGRIGKPTALPTLRAEPVARLGAPRGYRLARSQILAELVDNVPIQFVGSASQVEQHTVHVVVSLANRVHDLLDVLDASAQLIALLANTLLDLADAADNRFAFALGHDPISFRHFGQVTASGSPSVVFKFAILPQYVMPIPPKAWMILAVLVFTSVMAHSE